MILQEEVSVLVKALLVGYYGYGNMGDEMLLKSSYEILKVSGLHFVDVLYPRKERLGGMRSKARFSPKEILNSIKESEIVVFGGGGVLQDETSFRSFIYYFSVATAALSMKKPVVFLGSGLGPLRRRATRALTAWLLRRKNVYFFSRDPVSERYVSLLGGWVKKGTDLAVGILRKFRFEGVNDEVIIAPKKMRNWEEAVRSFKMDGLKVSFLVSSPEDWRNIKQLGKIDVYTGLPIDVIARARLVISERFHPILISAYFGVPFVSVGSLKAERFFKDVFSGYEGFAKKDLPDVIYRAHRVMDVRIEVKNRLDGRFDRMVEDFGKLILNL